MSLCPVKKLSSKVLLIRNIGNKDAKFSFKTEKYKFYNRPKNYYNKKQKIKIFSIVNSRPFVLNPEHGILPVGENMQVNVDFQPQKCGEYSNELCVSYDTGDCLFVRLYGAAQDINVRLEKNSTRIEETFITMSNQHTVKLSNRSDEIVHYEWKKFATVEEEEQQKLREITMLNRDEENAKHKLAQLNPDHLALLSRNFKNKVVIFNVLKS